MAQIPAYERDPRLTRLEADVLSEGEENGHPFVVLSDTILFPAGGGQPSDLGTVGGVAVLDVRKVDGVVRHVLEGAGPSALAGRVTVVLDWARRFDHMQQHTAQHLLTAVAERRFGWHTTSFHLGESTCDIEVDVPNVDASHLAELEEAVAAEIRAARPVTTRRISAEECAALAVRSRRLPAGHAGDIRLVEIQGIDLNTCGGTHCASTSEIGALKLLGTEDMRGGTRLSWVAGARLRKLLETHHRRNARLREVLGTCDEDLVTRVESKLEQLRQAQRSVRSLQEELADAWASALAAGEGRVLVAHWPGRDLPFLQRAAKEACRLAPHDTVLLTTTEGEGEGDDGAFVLAAGEAAGIDVTAVGRQIAGLLGGRGGGSGSMFQGKAGRISQRTAAAELLGRVM